MQELTKLSLLISLKLKKKIIAYVNQKVSVFQALTISKLYVDKIYFIFSSVYPFAASAEKHSSWVPMLLLVSDPNDTVTSNSFDVPVGFVMLDIVIIIGDVILNLVTLKQNHTKHLKKISISKYWYLWLMTSDI